MLFHGNRCDRNVLMMSSPAPGVVNLTRSCRLRQSAFHFCTPADSCAISTLQLITPELSRSSLTIVLLSCNGNHSRIVYMVRRRHECAIPLSARQHPAQDITWSRCCARSTSPPFDHFHDNKRQNARCAHQHPVFNRQRDNLEDRRGNRQGQQSDLNAK